MEDMLHILDNRNLESRLEGVAKVGSLRSLAESQAKVDVLSETLVGRSW